MSKKKQVTYSLVCFLCFLKASKKNCLFAFMLFMSEGLFTFYVIYE